MKKAHVLRPVLNGLRNSWFSRAGDHSGLFELGGASIGVHGVGAGSFGT
jgi:hypothetical protein